MEKIKWVILLSLLVIGVGILEISHPDAMDGFKDNYTGRGVAGLIVLLFELFLMLTWGKIGGTFIILLGVLTIIICLLSNSNQVKKQLLESSSTENKKDLSENKKNLSAADTLSSIALCTGKAYVQRQLRN